MRFVVGSGTRELELRSGSVQGRPAVILGIRAEGGETLGEITLTPGPFRTLVRFALRYLELSGEPYTLSPNDRTRGTGGSGPRKGAR